LRKAALGALTEGLNLLMEPPPEMAGGEAKSFPYRIAQDENGANFCAERRILARILIALRIRIADNSSFR
jgi:hypothetical protein